MSLANGPAIRLARYCPSGSRRCPRCAPSCVVGCREDARRSKAFMKVNGKLCYIWRAVDHEGEVLESGVTAKRDKAAARSARGGHHIAALQRNRPHVAHLAVYVARHSRRAVAIMALIAEPEPIGSPRKPAQPRPARWGNRPERRGQPQPVYAPPRGRSREGRGRTGGELDRFEREREGQLAELLGPPTPGPENSLSSSTAPRSSLRAPP